MSLFFLINCTDTRLVTMKLQHVFLKTNVFGLVGNYTFTVSTDRRCKLKNVDAIPQHGPWWWRWLIQLFISLGLSSQLFIDVACSHTYPQSRSQSRVVQQDTHLKDINYITLLSVCQSRSTENENVLCELIC